MPFNDPVIFALREDWKGNLSKDREAVKQAIAALPVLIEALQALTPYLERMSQPGERWPAFCARQALQAAGILPPSESNPPATQSSETSSDDKLFSGLLLILQYGDEQTAEASPEQMLKDVEFLSAIVEAAVEPSLLKDVAKGDSNALSAYTALINISLMLTATLEKTGLYEPEKQALDKTIEIAQKCVDGLVASSCSAAEPTFQQLYARKF